MIEIRNLTKVYGDIRAVNNISFTIQEGEIVGFLGPNGAGKSTTLKILTGFVQPTSGEVKVRNLDIQTHSLEVRSLLGYLPEQNPLYEEMSVYDYLFYISQLRSMTLDQFSKRLDFVIATCGLREVITQTIQTLSKGYRQRVGIAQAILHDPAFLILDEPTSGLDPNQILEIRALIRDLGKHKTVILSSHILQEIQAVADRIIIINKGVIVADGAPSVLQQQLIEKTQFIMHFDAENPDIDGLLATVDAQLLSHTISEDGIHHLTLQSFTDAEINRKIALYARAQNWLVLEMYKEEMSLEDLFHNLTMNSVPVMDETQTPEEESSETEDTHE